MASVPATRSVTEVPIVPALFFIFAFLSPLVLLDAFANVFGVDSRDGFTDPRDRPESW
jgi:hypothetical protein